MTQHGNADLRDVPVCVKHQTKVRKKGLDGLLASVVRHESASERIEKGQDGMTKTLTRGEYLRTMAQMLSTTTYFRGAYLPSCFHPDWFFGVQSRAAGTTPMSPGSAAMDSNLRRLLFDDDPTVDVRIVIRTDTIAYRTKIEAAIDSPRAVRALRDDTIDAIQRFHAAAPPHRGVVPLNIDHSRIAYVFRDRAFAARRATPSTTIVEALETSDPSSVEFERGCIDTLFDQTLSDLDSPESSIVRFVEQALEPLAR